MSSARRRKIGGPESVRVVLSSSSSIALRREVEGASHAVQEIVLRMRTAARDMRRGVLARRLHGPPPRMGYEWRVRIRLTGLTPPRRSRVRAAAAVAAANSGPIGSFAIHSGEGGHQAGADASPALSLPPRSAD